MVFESLVSDLLNKFIGNYVENLDKSHLKIGIWGGKATTVIRAYRTLIANVKQRCKVHLN